MTRSFPTSYLFFALLVVALIPACSDGGPTSLQPVAELEVEGPETMLEGETVQAEAVALDEEGLPIEDALIEWSTSDPEVVDVSPGGFLTAEGVGTATITAAVDDVSAFFEVEVQENPCDSPVGELAVGDTVSGELTSESCFIDEWFYDPWLLEVTEPVEVRIELESDDFIPYLLLTDEFLNQLAENESPGEGEPAVLEGTLPAGDVLIWVSTSVPDEVGDYELSVSEVDGS
ncbi:MAG: hypothetical protein EA422_11850 [Gemmatimonadales bacterium]|nr:MAG: hypothetical protein EA422_11850 [Gemmatimonadales bacterium]